MTDIGEMVKKANLADKKDKCPFCPNKELKSCKGTTNKKVSKVVSKPNQLACSPLTPKGEHKYTTAKHHLISAKQCYAKIKQVVRMGSMSGYDINDPPNGIGLPTVANNLRFTVGTARKKKYGQLTGPQKEIVAFAVMATDAAGAQWHVGHHAVEIEIADNWADEMEDAAWRQPHYVQYDTEVQGQLLKIASKYKPARACDKKRPDKFKSDMDDLSDKIKQKLDKFSGKKPGASAPYFVSALAAKFATAKTKKKAPKARARKTR
jgi:hypothetical protein